MIKSLVKDFTKQNVPEVRGPITIVQGSVLHCLLLLLLFFFSCMYREFFIPNLIFWLVMVLGKHRRFQFVECPNDVNAMVDCAKVADLALLVVDGSYGFEMVRDHFSAAFSFCHPVFFFIMLFGFVKNLYYIYKITVGPFFVINN